MGQFEQEIERTSSRAAQGQATQPRALAARYGAERRCIVIDLSTGYAVTFSPEQAQGLQHAAAELAEIEITTSGDGPHFRKLDADLLPPQLAGAFGSRARGRARRMRRRATDLVPKGHVFAGELVVLDD